MEREDGGGRTGEGQGRSYTALAEAESAPEGGQRACKPQRSAILSPGKHQSLFALERQGLALLVLVTQQPGTAQQLPLLCLSLHQEHQPTFLVSCL